MEAAAASIAFITFSLQGIIEGYGIFNKFKNVPGDVDELLESVKSYLELFSDLKDHTADPNIVATVWSSREASRNLERAETACRALDDYIRGLKTELDRSRLKYKVMTKIVLKEAKLAELKQRLTATKDMLALSLQGFSIALNRNQTAHILQRIETIPKAVVAEILQQQVAVGSPELPRYQPPGLKGGSPPGEFVNFEWQAKPQLPLFEDGEGTMGKPSDGVMLNLKSRWPTVYGRFAVRYRKQTGAWRVYIQMPMWLSSSIYELETKPSPTGWSLQSRAYNVIPWDSEIFLRIEHGDLSGVKQMLQTRRASLFDVTESGMSLLGVATQAVQPEMVRFFLDSGLGTVFNDNKLPDPFRPLIPWGSWANDKEIIEITEMVQPHLQNPDSVDIYRIFKGLELWPYDKCAKYKDRFMPKYFDTLLQDRLEAFRMGSFVMRSPGQYEKLLTSDGSISKLDAALSTSEKLSVLHSVAIMMGRRYPDVVLPHLWMMFPSRIWCSTWEDIVIRAIKATNFRHRHPIEHIVPWNIDPVPAWTGTPFISLIAGTICFLANINQSFHWEVAIQKTVRHWARLLSRSGVNLLEYGREEQDIIRRNKHGVRGYFDADAIRNTRMKGRKKLFPDCELLRKNYRNSWRTDCKYTYLEPSQWRPIRIIDLHISLDPDEWQLEWVFEVETYAREFWKLVEPDEFTSKMPGGWVE